MLAIELAPVTCVPGRVNMKGGGTGNGVQIKETVGHTITAANHCLAAARIPRKSEPWQGLQLVPK
jgi:hypothetical protein